MTKSCKSTEPDYSAIDIDELLTQRRQVAVLWDIEDVHNMRPDLNDDQAWEVLKQCRKRHDCEFGFTWSLIDMVAGDIFPEPEDSEEGDCV